MDKQTADAIFQSVYEAKGSLNLLRDDIDFWLKRITQILALILGVLIIISIKLYKG